MITATTRQILTLRPARPHARLAWALLLGAGLLAPLLVYPTFLMKIMCFALFASAFNLLLGYGGLLSFGHAAFFGGAAYVCALLVKNFGVSPELGVLAGTAFGAALGALFGLLAIRRAGIYFSMITLALAQIVYFFVVQLPFTGGEDGLQGVPRGKLLGIVDLNDTLPMYYFVFAIFCAGFWLIRRTIHSPFGQVMKAIRDNEPRAVSLGYDVARYKLLLFTLSAGLSGAAGATKTLVFQLATLTDVHMNTSGQVIMMTLLGGMGTLFGPSAGALMVVSLESELADKVGSWMPVIMGTIFVVCVLAFRRGVVGEFIAWRATRRGAGGR